MQRLSADTRTEIRFQFEGRTLPARQGDSVAAALLAADEWAFRTTTVSGAPRGPYCMMGVCFDCLVEIDGVANRQACMIEVREGMQVKRQAGAARTRPV
jgi:predicted molibdopterin-dependent oxidoreductase YjgC